MLAEKGVYSKLGLKNEAKDSFWRRNNELGKPGNTKISARSCR